MLVLEQAAAVVVLVLLAQTQQAPPTVAKVVTVGKSLSQVKASGMAAAVAAQALTQVQAVVAVVVLVSTQGQELVEKQTPEAVVVVDELVAHHQEHKAAAG